MITAVATVRHNWNNLWTRWGWLVRGNWTFLLVWSLLIWSVMRPCSGSFLVVVGDLVFAYQVIKYLWLVREPQSRQAALFVMFVISLSLPVVTTIGAYRSNEARVDVNRIVIGVETFRNLHGRLPQSLAEAGIRETALVRELRLRYMPDSDYPSIWVRDPFVDDKYFVYELKTHTWRAGSGLV